MEKEAKQLFAYLELNTDNVIKLDTLMVNLKDLKVNFTKDGLVSEHFPLPGGILLKSIGLILRSIEFIGDSFFYLIETL